MKLPKNVEQIWKDDDGWWIILQPGWVVDDCIGFREDTKALLLKTLKRAKPGIPR